MVTWSQEDPYSWLENLNGKWQERLDCGFRGTIQNEENNHTFRLGGKTNNYTQFSTDIDYHYLGCLVSSLDLRLPTFREDEIKNANKLSNEKYRTLSRKLDNNSTGSKIATINREYNVLKRDFETKRNSCEVHDGCISSLQIPDEPPSDRIESRKYADVESGIRCGECPNQERIDFLQSRFGELFRVGALGGDAWTTETHSETCRLVHAHPFPTQESTIEDKGTVSQVPACAVQNGKTLRYNNNSILVDAFKKSGRSRIGTFIGSEILKDSDPKELISFIESVAEFGFNHIVIIGEIYSGMIFLDCYGRVFVWEDEGQVLIPLGNSPEEASKSSIGGDKLVWFVENGNVYEYIKKPHIFSDTIGQERQERL